MASGNRKNIVCKSRYLITFIAGLFLINISVFPETWGDTGNGTYINPILNADYSDPDVIRVNDKYYMVCSEFHFMGMPVLESDDMVNWKIISQVFDHFDYPGWTTNERYAGGSWAPSIRYHDGKFWVFFCNRHEGLFMSNAVDPRGPWSPLHNLKEIEKWEDPCPFWDEDGKAYLGRSQWGAGPIIIHKMSPDGRTLLDDGVTVYTGPVAEGTKIFKRNGFYYISIPEGGVERGWQTVLRSKNIYGPYEKKVVLEKGSTDINGPHQGAFVDTPDGKLWFYHFQMTGALGRVVHLQPARWVDDWPVAGVDIDMNGIGEPVYSWKKPIVSKDQKIYSPQSSDEFSDKTLGLQWQFNHNPVNKAISLTEKPGWLSMNALKSVNMLKSRNMLTQKIMGYKSSASVLMDFSKMKNGQKSGICCLGKEYFALGVMKSNDIIYLYTDANGQIEKGMTLKTSKIYLKADIDVVGNNDEFFYSLNGKEYKQIGKPFKLMFGNWKGARICLYNYNEIEDGGVVSFDWFRYLHDGPSETLTK
jgi:beta-xylosidase